MTSPGEVVTVFTSPYLSAGAPAQGEAKGLIPEFFCFPEMFYNLNDLSLSEAFDEKMKQTKLVNNILLPPWKNND